MAARTGKDGSPDPYGPRARGLPVADIVQGLIMGPLRRGIVGLLGRRGLNDVLDVGCGTGALCRRLADAGLAPVGVDASPTMLARAEAKARRAPAFEVVPGDADRLPFDQTFDAAVICLALHEMDPDLRVAVYAEMGRVVRPGGILVLADFTVPPRRTLPARAAGRFIAMDERQIGRVHPPHYANYREFMAGGGLAAWVAAHGGPVVEEGRYLWGNVGLLAVERR